MDRIPWYSLFSHTGAETERLADALSSRFELRCALTNNMNYWTHLHWGSPLYGKVIKTFSDNINATLGMGSIPPGSLITLNGYNRILPGWVLEALRRRCALVYNIHPAPIQLYPELRGLDPHRKLYEGVQSGKYQFIGVVIHEVDEGVDTGPVAHWKLKLADPSWSYEELCEESHALGFEAWMEFFNGQNY